MPKHFYELSDNGKLILIVEFPVFKKPKELKSFLKKLVADKEFIEACDNADSIMDSIEFESIELANNNAKIKLNFTDNCHSVGITLIMFTVITMLDDDKTPDEVASHFKKHRKTIDSYISRAKARVLKKYPKALLPTYVELKQYLNLIW